MNVKKISITPSTRFSRMSFEEKVIYIEKNPDVKKLMSEGWKLAGYDSVEFTATLFLTVIY